jgi:hypothetical protein
MLCDTIEETHLDFVIQYFCSFSHIYQFLSFVVPTLYHIEWSLSRGFSNFFIFVWATRCPLPRHPLTLIYYHILRHLSILIFNFPKLFCPRTHAYHAPGQCPCMTDTTSNGTLARLPYFV